MKVAVVLVILLLGLAGFFYVSSRRDNTPKMTEEALVQDDNTEDMLEQVFGKPVPDDVQKATLVDLTNEDLIAMATRKETLGLVEFSVLADLPEGTEYEVWAGDTSENAKLLGELKDAKAGYLFESKKQGNIDEYKFVAVKRGDQKILEGSF